MTSSVCKIHCQPKLSVIISNYNYSEFIGDAIKSALQLEWDNKEIIVVDDGSTDDSRSVIEGFGDRVKSIFQSNQGQFAACNTGFAVSTGDLIIFLDSDDFIDKSLMEHILIAWDANATKYQVQMHVVDKNGVPLGSVYPQYNNDEKPAHIRSCLLATGFYQTPPGSGNIYSRKFLERLFPIKQIGTPASDLYCIAAAPLFGDVITIARPLVSYRVHGRNDGAMRKLDPARLTRDVSRAVCTFEFTSQLASSLGISLSSQAPWNSFWLLPYRVGSWKLNRKRHPVARDTAVTFIADAGRALFVGQGMRLRARMLLTAWCLAVLASPTAVARHLILWRFAPQARPQVVGNWMRRIGVVR